MFRTVLGLSLVALSLLGAAACSSDDAPATDSPGSSSGGASSGGASSGGTSSGGTSSGATSSGGTSSGGASSGGADAGQDGDDGLGLCSGAALEPAAAATIDGYIDTLPYDKPTGAARAEVVDAVLRTCHVFSPDPAQSPGWEKRFCWAHLVGAMLKESSYNAALLGNDAYSKRTLPGGQKANDPTVGLLQIRFSATVRDYSVLGPPDKMACIGCTFPASFASHKNESSDSSFWSVTGPTQNMALMKSRACNIGLGAWYYYASATSNGKPNQTTYAEQYCAGGGTAGNLITGLRSHLKGPDGGRGVIGNMNALNALQTSDATSYEYVTEIKSWFDVMTSPTAATHPFFVRLAPQPTQYCN